MKRARRVEETRSRLADACVHEASHLVVALHLGLVVSDVVLSWGPNGPNRNGELVAFKAGVHGHSVSMHDRGLVAVAGSIGELIGRGADCTPSEIEDLLWSHTRGDDREKCIDSARAEGLLLGKWLERTTPYVLKILKRGWKDVITAASVMRKRAILHVEKEEWRDRFSVEDCFPQRAQSNVPWSGETC